MDVAVGNWDFMGHLWSQMSDRAAGSILLVHSLIFALGGLTSVLPFSVKACFLRRHGGHWPRLRGIVWEQKREERDVVAYPVIPLASRGQSQLFTSSLALHIYEEDGSPLHGDMLFAAGYGARRSLRFYSIGHGERRVWASPSPAPYSLLARSSPAPILQTLAAATKPALLITWGGPDSVTNCGSNRPILWCTTSL
jgi:hypothetical protein